MVLKLLFQRINLDRSFKTSCLFDHDLGSSQNLAPWFGCRILQITIHGRRILKTEKHTFRRCVIHFRSLLLFRLFFRPFCFLQYFLQHHGSDFGFYLVTDRFLYPCQLEKTCSKNTQNRSDRISLYRELSSMVVPGFNFAKKWKNRCWSPSALRAVLHVAPFQFHHRP